MGLNGVQDVAEMLSLRVSRQGGGTWNLDSLASHLLYHAELPPRCPPCTTMSYSTSFFSAYH